MKWRLLIPLIIILSMDAGCSPITPIVPQPTVPFPEGPCVDAYAGAFVWKDLNGNGVREQEEPPLPGVCIIATNTKLSGDEEWVQSWCGLTGEEASPYALTDSNGQWVSMSPVAGSCDDPQQVAEQMQKQCEDIWIVVIPPPDYVVTTLERVNDCGANFGLVYLYTPTIELPNVVTPTVAPEP